MLCFTSKVYHKIRQVLYYKIWQFYCKMGQLLQNPTFIIKYGVTFTNTNFLFNTPFLFNFIFSPRCEQYHISIHWSDVFRTQSNISDETLLRKQLTTFRLSQKGSIIDIRPGSKYTSVLAPLFYLSFKIIQIVLKEKWFD